MGNSNAAGTLGGYGPRGMPLAGTFYGRSGATRELALRDGGGTKESEAAVARGLQWLIRHQQSDGRWTLDDPRFSANGAWPTTSPAPPSACCRCWVPARRTSRPRTIHSINPSKEALQFLLNRQDKRTGYFGGGMYAHGLATIVICEAYGLTQDPNLRRPAQMAITYIVNAQHDAGGWRYKPGQAGDTSVFGWQVMALKSAQIAGLDVPELTMKKAQNFLEAVVPGTLTKATATPAVGSTPTLSAVGLLCRQYLQSWGPQNLRMIKGVENHIKANGPQTHDMYYSYYATQVMHHFGGQSWKDWNEKMREGLIAEQDKGTGPMNGSWTSIGGGQHVQNSGGRLMQTSLCLLTLEVYYRHLPLYYRDPGEKKLAAQQ